MAVVIKPRRRMSDDTAPTTANLQDGELAVNTVSRKIYMRVGAAIIELFKSLSRDDVGLSNVDNTSDNDKPVSTAQQSALDAKYPNDAATALGLHPLANPPPTPADLNTALGTGQARFGRIIGSTTNTPFQWGTFVQAPYSAGEGAQLAMSVTTDQIAWRRNTGPWHQIYHSGNFANGTAGQYLRGNGTLTADGILTASRFTAPQANGAGLRFWADAGNVYTIHMSSAGDATFGGRAPGETTSDYNMYFRMTSGTNRGFVFQNGGNSVAGIDAAGSGYFKSHVYSSEGQFFDVLGNVRKLPVTTVNATYTITASDFNTAVEKSNNTAYTYTLPNIGVQGHAITFINSGTAGNLTIARGTGVSLLRNGVDANIVVGPGSMTTIVRSANTGRWIA